MKTQLLAVMALGIAACGSDDPESNSRANPPNNNDGNEGGAVAHSKCVDEGLEIGDRCEQHPGSDLECAVAPGEECSLGYVKVECAQPAAEDSSCVRAVIL